MVLGSREWMCPSSARVWSDSSSSLSCESLSVTLSESSEDLECEGLEVEEEEKEDVNEPHKVSKTRQALLQLLHATFTITAQTTSLQYMSRLLPQFTKTWGEPVRLGSHTVSEPWNVIPALIREIRVGLADKRVKEAKEIVSGIREDLDHLTHLWLTIRHF